MKKTIREFINESKQFTLGKKLYSNTFRGNTREYYLLIPNKYGQVLQLGSKSFDERQKLANLYDMTVDEVYYKKENKNKLIKLAKEEFELVDSYNNEDYKRNNDENVLSALELKINYVRSKIIKLLK
jgi:DNA polymerase III sliding clamp (beta) subunit (PCNA family)